MGTNFVTSWKRIAKLLQDGSSGSANADAAVRSVVGELDKLKQLPMPPKAVWKKLVQNKKVPFQLGAAFTAAAQHSWRSPVTQAAVSALISLLRAAVVADVIKGRDRSSGSLEITIREQLQQSGMLQQLSAVMQGMTAELQAETAFLAAGGWDAVGGDVKQFSGAGSLQLQVAPLVCLRHQLWQFRESQGLSEAALLVWNPYRDAGYVLQFTVAALQHISSIVQHVLPAVQECAPQQAAALVSRLQENSDIAWRLCASTLTIQTWRDLQLPPQQPAQGIPAGVWQQVLLSPHLLPCVSAVVVASYLGRSVGTHCVQVEGSSASSSSGGRSSGRSSSGGRSSRSSSSICGRSSGSGSSGGCSSGSSSSGGRSSGSSSIDTFLACQLQLLQVVGLAPEVIDWVLHGFEAELSSIFLHVAIDACAHGWGASWQLLQSSSTGSGVPVEQQHRWQFERQLWQLLPTALLPCARNLLLGASLPRTVQVEGMVQQILNLSEQALALSAELHMRLSTLGIPSAAPPAAWVGELLGVLLQLAEQLLDQHPPSLAEATAATLGQALSTSINTSTSTIVPQQELRSACARHLLVLLTQVTQDSQASALGPSSNDNSQVCSAAVPVGLLPVAARFVEVASTLEAAVRTVAAPVHTSTLKSSCEGSAFAGGLQVFSSMLLSCDKLTDSMLLRHLGLRGSVALAQEQQQLYSLLSTMQKLGHCARAGAQGDWQEPIAACCCLAAGQAAVGLLKMASAAGATGQQAFAAAAAVPTSSYLPSLVLFGRCLLGWAGEMLLLGSVELQHENTEALLSDYGAACVCIPGLRQGSATLPGQWVESLAAVVSEWVSQCGIGSPAAEHLEAAGCSPQQLQQQLEALLSAQQGTQQELTDASVAALAQQLQATGAMLSSIAVPHFCNNSACVNLSGPTEVRLVSGRSCVCAGCRVARYCGRACQRAAWKQHKPVCNMLAAAQPQPSLPQQ